MKVNLLVLILFWLMQGLCEMMKAFVKDLKQPVTMFLSAMFEKKSLPKARIFEAVVQTEFSDIQFKMMIKHLLLWSFCLLCGTNERRTCS